MDKVYCCSVWFSTAQEQKAVALNAGHPKKHIYTEGEHHEDFMTCVRSYRDGGRMGLVGGLYILARNSEMLKVRLEILREHRIVPYDFETKEDDGAKLYSEAMSNILGNKRFKGDKKHHKRISAKGGNAKREKAADKRNAIMQEDIVRRLCAHPKLTWEDRVRIMGGAPFTKATLQRHYGPEKYEPSPPPKAKPKSPQKRRK